MRSFRLVIFACVGLCFSILEAQEETKTKPIDRWVEYYKGVAKGYDIRLDSAPDAPLKLVEAPILVYANPTSSRDTHGAIFAWTRNGRIEVMAALWSKLTAASPTSDRTVNHEFYSLATEPLVANGKEGLKWSPEQPGIEFRPFPDAPIPATSRALRLVQMREMTRQLTGYDRYPKEDGSEEMERPLRALPTPLFRYSDEERKNGPSDGAVFGYFFDWDPEILLVIESQPTAQGLRWHYGIGYLDNKPLRLEYKGADLWKREVGGFGTATSIYYVAFGVTTRSNDPD